MSNDRGILPYDLFVLGLSVFALFLLGARATVARDPELERIIDIGDLVICCFFLFDFVRSFVRSRGERSRYLFTWGWIDLLASIPAIDILRLGRLARVLRILRVFRLVKASTIIARTLRTHKRESAIWATTLVVIVVILTASVAVLEVESREDGNISSAEDALWWTITTIATVGFGDRYPVTTEGRLIAILLMGVGVGLSGTISGLAASWFVEPFQQARSKPVSGHGDD